MPRPIGRPPGRPPSRPGQTRGGRRGRLEAFERQATERAIATIERAAAAGPIELPSVVTVGDLANLLGVGVAQVIKALVGNGIMATINQSLDYETAAIVAGDLGFDVREQGTAVAPAAEPQAPATDSAAVEAAASLAEEEREEEAQLRPRPPVVTIMGHVDHGKTSLLDAVRHTRVAAGEAGGITQHIGAYQVAVGDSTVTFLDTPGHEAFTAMRARGAQVTDIAVIVVAADDGVMPQTKEAIDHARAAGVPIVVAINKVDLPNANPDRVKEELASNNLVVTDYGGTVESVRVSAKTGQGLQDLLETILLVAEAEVTPRANPDRPAEGVVVEAKLDKSRGPVATVLVKRGTLRVGDVVIAGTTSGKMRALCDAQGRRVQAAPPSFPVEVLGLQSVPTPGDRVRVVADERTARDLTERATLAGRREEAEVSPEALFARIRSGTIKELNLIVKADVQGSVEPIVSSIEKVGSQFEARAKVIHAGVGNVNVTDVNLGVASGAIVIAFNVRTEPEARRIAESSGVSIRDYTVIYALLEDVEKLLTGTLEPRYQEVVHGHAEVRATFKAGKHVVAGCYVTDGVLHRRHRVRQQRAGKAVWEGGVESLRRFKDDVTEVRESYECGILLDGQDDIAVADVLEFFSSERV